jgi:hypothetical protein
LNTNNSATLAPSLTTTIAEALILLSTQKLFPKPIAETSLDANTVEAAKRSART